MTVTVEQRTYSCGTGAYEHPNGRLVAMYDLPNHLKNNPHEAVFRVRQRSTLYLVIANGRRVDSFLKKRNADRLAAQLRRAEG